MNRNAEWNAWAGRTFPAHPDRQEAAAQAAVDALDAGLSQVAAVAAAWAGAGLPLPADDMWALWNELKTVERVAADLAPLKPSGELTEAALAQLRHLYDARLARLTEIYSSARAGVVGVPGSTAVAAAVASATPSPPGPSMREFFADNSILIISIAGAVLLMVSTLLFEIYGTTGLGGEVRFSGVLILNLVFGAAGYLCFGRPRLRVVGQTYVAIFALMVPLTIAAAWVFLVLESRGISSTLAAGLGGIGCALLYAVLAERLGSRGYAALSLLALAIGVAGLVASAKSQTWTAPLFAALTAVYIGIAYPPKGGPRVLATLSRVAEPFIHAGAVAALLWAAWHTSNEDFFAVPPAPTLQLSATFAVVTVAYALYAWRTRRNAMWWAVWAGSSLTLLAAVQPLGLGARGYLAELVVLAWIYALGSRLMPTAGLRTFVRVGAAVQAGSAAVVGAGPNGFEAIALLAASGVGLLFALEDGRPAWLLLSVGTFTVDWFWIVSTLVPPPPQPGPDDLVKAFSPLPAVFGAVGIALRLAGRRRWSWPAYAGGGIVGVGVSAGALGSNDLLLAGRSLLVYAAIAYAATLLHRWWPGVLVAAAAAAASVMLLLAAASASTYWYPLLVTGVGLAAYAGSHTWAVPDLARVHRWTGLGLVCATALVCFGVPEFWQPSAPGPLAALAVLLAGAVTVLVDGRVHRLPIGDYAAAAAASLGGVWVAEYAGAQNLQAFVALPGVTLIAIGLTAARDRRHPANLALCRLVIAAGGGLLLGASLYQSVTMEDASLYTIVLVVEAVALLLIGIGGRSRTLVLVGGAGLAVGSLRALFLILESVQVYVVFGAIAMLLLVGAGILAAVRDRLSAARASVRTSWDQWT